MTKCVHFDTFGEMPGAETGIKAPREERISRIIELRRDGKWDPATSTASLADEFNVSIDTIRLDHYIASRDMRANMGDREQIQLDTYLNLLRVGEKAEAGVNCDESDYKAAYKAYEAAGKFIGAQPAQKVDHSVVVAHIPTEQLIAEAAKLTAKIKEQEGVLMLPEGDRDDPTNEQHDTSTAGTETGTDDP